VHRSYTLAQLGEVLSMLQAFEQIALRSLLTMRQCFEDAMLVEKPCDFVEALLKTCFGTSGSHSGPPVKW
jgi:hypothetical protein